MIQSLTQIIQLEQQLRQCDTLTELGFAMTHYTRQITQYDQALLLLGHSTEPLRVFSVSDHPTVDRTSPMLHWVESIVSQERWTASAESVHVLDTQAWTDENLRSLHDFSPEHILWVPLLLPSKSHTSVGVLWLSRSDLWTDRDIALLTHLSGSFAHAIQGFQKTSSWITLRQWLRKSHFPRYAIGFALLLMFVPVTLTVLAPAEVVAHYPMLVTAPMPGVVSKVDVLPGQSLLKDQVIVTLDDQDINSRYQVAEQDYFRALAEWKTAQQSGFVDPKQKSRVNELSAQVAIKLAEKNLVYEQLQKTIVKAPIDGIAIISDPQEWRGKPVVIGEKILQIADANQVALRIMLPVKDAIAMRVGAKVQFFPDANPLMIHHGSLHYAAYEPELTPEDVVAYKLTAYLDDHEDIPRIGWRGTAKIEGETVSLFYYLLRRPIITIRQWTGW